MRHINTRTRTLLVVLALAPIIAHSVATRAGVGTQASPMTRSVDVDGLSIRVRTAGLDDRKPGEAAIVFESGGSAPLETWDPILPAVARFAPVVAYDRAGTGQSAWDGLPPTPERVVTRLRRLLSELHVAPPYILVGHSWGGALARYFAGAHPETIAGILYIDPTDITQTTADEIAAFQSIGAGAAEHDAFDRLMDQSMAGAPAPIRAEGAVVMSLLRSDLERRALPAAPRVATSVILAGKLPVFPPNLLPFDTKAYAKATLESRITRLRGWVVDGGTFEVAASAGHFVHADVPELVIAAIGHLVKIGSPGGARVQF